MKTGESQLSNHVKRLRKARRLTQEILGERSGLSADTIRRLEVGDFSPSLRTLRKLCKGLGISLSTMFTAMEIGDDQYDADMEALLALLREHPRFPVRIITDLIQAMIGAGYFEKG